MNKTLRIHYAGGTFKEFVNQSPTDLARVAANSTVEIRKATEIVGETDICNIVPLGASSVRPRVTPPKPEYTLTMPCYHCVVGTAKQIAQNENVGLYLCPRCGGHSTLTDNSWWGIGFRF